MKFLEKHNLLEGWNGHILREPQPSKTEPGRNRKYEQTNHKHWNLNCD